MRTFLLIGLFMLGWSLSPHPATAVNYPNVAVMDPRNDTALAVDRGGLIGFNNFPAAFDVNLPNPLPVSMSASINVASMPSITIASAPAQTIASMPNVAGTVTTQAQGSSGVATPVACDQTARISGTSSAVLVTHAANKTTYVCSYAFSLDLTASAAASLKWGTGTNCGTATANLSAVLQNTALGLLTSQTTSEGAGVGTIDQSPVAATSDLCIVDAGGGTVVGSVRYASF